MIFTWSRTTDAVVVSTCRVCGSEVARSRSERAVEKAQRAHYHECQRPLTRPAVAI